VAPPIHIDTYLGNELVGNTGEDRNGLILSNAIRDRAIFLEAEAIGTVCRTEPGFPVLVDGVEEFEACRASRACAKGIGEAEAFGQLPVGGDKRKHSCLLDVRVNTRAEADDCVRPDFIGNARYSAIGKSIVLFSDSPAHWTEGLTKSLQLSVKV